MGVSGLDAQASWSALAAPVGRTSRFQTVKAQEFASTEGGLSGSSRRWTLAYSVEGTLRLLEYVTGQPALQLRSTTNPFGSSSVHVSGLMEMDANGDATPDLLGWNGGTIKLIEVQACVPTATQTFSQGIVDHHMPAAGDLDQDGDQDLVIWDMLQYVVARRTGAAAWSIEPPVTGGAGGVPVRRRRGRRPRRRVLRER